MKFNEIVKQLIEGTDDKKYIDYNYINSLKKGDAVALVNDRSILLQRAKDVINIRGKIGKMNRHNGSHTSIIPIIIDLPEYLDYFVYVNYIDVPLTKKLNSAGAEAASRIVDILDI